MLDVTRLILVLLVGHLLLMLNDTLERTLFAFCWACRTSSQTLDSIQYCNQDTHLFHPVCAPVPVSTCKPLWSHISNSYDQLSLHSSRFIVDPQATPQHQASIGLSQQTQTFGGATGPRVRESSQRSMLLTSTPPLAWTSPASDFSNAAAHSTNCRCSNCVFFRFSKTMATRCRVHQPWFGRLAAQCCACTSDHTLLWGSNPLNLSLHA
jgi:hypothetical protein